VGNDPLNLLDRTGMSAAGTTICEGICVGVRFSWSPEGFAACVETGFGIGSSVEVDPLADLDKTGASLEGKFAVNAGFLKTEVSLKLADCGNGETLWERTKDKATLKLEDCVGPVCLDSNGKAKGKKSFEGADRGYGGFGKLQEKSSAGLPVSGRLVGKVCQSTKL
jgi:hypothetical protein